MPQRPVQQALPPNTDKSDNSTKADVTNLAQLVTEVIRRSAFLRSRQLRHYAHALTYESLEGGGGAGTSDH